MLMIQCSGAGRALVLVLDVRRAWLDGEVRGEELRQETEVESARPSQAQ